ncbi:hypothetical protein L3X07_08260 [Levilactobacillus brevis]|nr:hypothetical protein [Levilactobacillus brevis]
MQPLVWLAILRVWLASRARIITERRNFGSAVYGDHYELRHMLTQGLLLGLGLSVINLLIGFSLPVIWILAYEV